MKIEVMLVCCKCTLHAFFVCEEQLPGDSVVLVLLTHYSLEKVKEGQKADDATLFLVKY